MEWYPYLKDVYDNENNFPELKKIFDSQNNGFENFHVKIFEIRNDSSNP